MAGSDSADMNARLPLLFLALATAISLAASPAAAASTTQVEQSESSNWSGYVVGGSGSGTHFRSISGSWVQPAISPGSSDVYSVFWVGLGGSNGTTDALEQIGTEASYVSGKLEYYAWYELVPSAPVRLQLTIRPGDRIAAAVSVDGTNVTVALIDRTTGRWVTKTLHMSRPDTSSAEWIAEVPSACDDSGRCTTLSLANFGTVRFRDATVTTNSGHTGTIADPSWSVQAVRLNAVVNEGGAAGPGFASYVISDGAEPSSLSADGSSFSVSYLNTWDSGPGATPPPAIVRAQ
jgi:Peptidase A4 family